MAGSVVQVDGAVFALVHLDEGRLQTPAHLLVGRDEAVDLGASGSGGAAYEELEQHRALVEADPALGVQHAVLVDQQTGALRQAQEVEQVPQVLRPVEHLHARRHRPVHGQQFAVLLRELDRGLEPDQGIRRRSQLGAEGKQIT